MKKILLVLLTSFFFGLLAGAQEGVTVTRGPGITSVTGTAPIVSSGGSAPAISCTAAGAGTTGCLTSSSGVGVLDAGLLANSYGNFYVTSTLDLVSSTNDATTSTTVAAVTIRPTVDLTAGDLVLNVEDSAGVNICTIDEQGAVAATSLAASAASGSNGYACITSGCRVDFGAGASDHASSNGTTVTFAGAVASVSTITAGNTFTCSSTSANCNIASSASDATVTAAIPGTSIIPTTAYAAGDAIFGVRASTGGNILAVYQGGGMGVGATMNWNATAPTITSACATAPTVTHGTATSFQIDVGTGCAGVSTVVLGLPTATNGWDCQARHKTTVAMTAAELECAGDTTTAITCTNFTRGTNTPLVLTDADDLVFSCVGR